MLTNAALVTLLNTNLNDDRSLSIQMYFTRLIDRKVFGNGINQYRIKNTVNNTYITTLAGFIAAISPIYIKPDYYYYATQTTIGDTIHPAIVLLTNLVVELSNYSDEDDIYTTNVGYGNKTIGLILSYMNESEPLKITDIKLL